MKRMLGLLGLILSGPLLLAQGDDDIPPRLAELKTYSCLASDRHEIVNGREVVSYGAHARASYREDAKGSGFVLANPELKKDWEKEISVRKDMKGAARDCLNWYEKVKRLQEKAAKPK